MNMTHPRFLMTTFVVAAVAISASPAFADGKNEIRAVTFDEDGGTTRVHVRGAQTPTFTVYKLERPSRVVIDVPQARLAEALRGHEGASVFTPSTWAVSTIAAQQIDDGGQIVRVIVTMARPGRYDVKTDGNEVVVMVTARDAAPRTANPEALARAQAESEQAKRAAATAEQARAQAEKTSAAAQAEAERLRKTAAEQMVRAEVAQRAADAAKRAGQQASSQDIEKAKALAMTATAEAAKAKAQAARAQDEAAKAKQQVAVAVDEVARMRNLAELAKREALIDAERARKEAAMAKQDVARTRAEADVAKQDAIRTKAEADAARKDMTAAQQDVVRTKAEAEAAKQAAAMDMARTRAEVDAAKRDAAQSFDAATRAKADAEAIKRDAAKSVDAAARAKADAEAVKRGAAEELAAANRARAEAEVARKEADVARRDAAKTKDAAARAKAEAEVARADAARTKAEAEVARADAARTKAEAEAARIEVEQARRDAAQKRMEAETAKHDIAKTNAVAVRAQSEAEAAKADAARARLEAKAARAEADAAKAAAAVDKRDAETDRKRAEAARLEATKLQKDAKAQLAALDRKTQTIQSLEDKARSAVAAAQAREEAAQETVARATREREAAEAAAKQAALARDRSSTQVAADRERLIAEATVAEDRLAKAKRAADEAEARKLAAETAAQGAKKDLDKTRVTLATVEQQRSAAERAASEAARKRGEAEAAATDASRRRSEAETAAAFAARQRTEAEAAAQAASKQRTEAEQQRIAAEAQRKAAEIAARDAQAAKVAADKQRAIAETAAQKAVGAKHDAEAGLEELMARRQAAEKAADQLEARSKAEAKAQAQVAAATARKATDDELAKARAQAGKLADERKRAETELADRRKAVAAQQAETDRLELAAASARDAAEREEKRRARLAEQRIAEEQELAQIKARKATAIKVAAVPVAPAPVVTSAPVVVAPKAVFVRNITFKGDEAGSRVEIAMTGEGKVTLGGVSATHVELIIDGAELGAKLERKLDVSKFGSSVRAISSFRDRATPNRVRLVAELSSPVTPTFDRDATGVTWSFASSAVSKRAPRTQNLPPTVVGGFGAASTPIAQQSVSQVPGTVPRNRKVYRGATVDFDFKDAPIHDLLRTIADTGKVNIVVPDGINARVTVRLKRVPWDQALEVILASHGLWYRRDGNLFRVAPRKELDAEDEAEAARREAMIKSEVPRSEIVPLNYSSAAELQTKLQAMLSPKGRLEVDDRTNSLIINDVAGNRAEIMKLALQLDTQTPQISIEARIVEARSTFVRQFGIQWGGRALAGAAGGNATGLVFPSSIGLQGGNDSITTPSGGVAQPSDFAINLPAATGGGEGGAIGLSLGSVGGNFALNLRLSALEDTGTVRIISAPKITVLNNKEAKISQGVSIPISVVSAAGTQTQFVQADLALTVTPYVSQRDCAIAMNLTVTKNEPDFVNVGARGDPSILRKEAKTSMLVNDGETSVLGGIYTRNSGLAYKKVPFFSDIPVLGWFFKNRRENDDRTEILVFITPKITNKALLRCQ